MCLKFKENLINLWDTGKMVNVNLVPQHWSI